MTYNKLIDQLQASAKGVEALAHELWELGNNYKKQTDDLFQIQSQLKQAQKQIQVLKADNAAKVIVFRYLKTTSKHLDYYQQDKTLLPIWIIFLVFRAEWTNHKSYQTLQYLLMEKSWHGKCRRQRSGTSLKSMLTTTWQLYPKLPMLQIVLKVMLQSTSM